MNNQSFDMEDIQKKIGYSFQNKKLLIQAFTRRSYAHEHPESADNEVLEFYGDKVLSIYLAKWFEESFEKEQVYKDYYLSKKNEGELTKLFSYYSDTEMLSKCIWNLGLKSYLLLGKSDINNEVWNNESVAEDLFEAILGAVAIDASWKFENIFPVCEAMLNVGEYSENYIRLLEDYCNDEDYILAFTPSFDSRNGYYSSVVKISEKATYWDYELEEEYGDGEEYCENEIFSFKADCCATPYIAQMEAAKKGVGFIENLLMRNCIGGEPDFERSVSQLQELYQHEWTDEPKYIFEESFDEDTGEHFWICKLDLESFDCYFLGKQKTKKEAKKEAAFNALKKLFS